MKNCDPSEPGSVSLPARARVALVDVAIAWSVFSPKSWATWLPFSDVTDSVDVAGTAPTVSTLSK